MSTAPQADSASEQEILDIEQAWIEAVIQRDKVAANKILADEFRLTGPALERLATGHAAIKEDWMATLEHVETKSFVLSDARVVIYGSAAVIFVRASLDWSVRGRQLPSHYMLTDLWVNRDGRWQVLTRVSEPLD